MIKVAFSKLCVVRVSVIMYSVLWFDFQSVNKIKF